MCVLNHGSVHYAQADIDKTQKLANKEVDKILRKGDEEEEGSDKESGKKKEKGVNIHRLMKNRLQKLVSLTDETYVLYIFDTTQHLLRLQWSFTLSSIYGFTVEKTMGDLLQDNQATDLYRRYIRKSLSNCLLPSRL